jgi:hypothetical protein
MNMLRSDIQKMSQGLADLQEFVHDYLYLDISRMVKPVYCTTHSATAIGLEIMALDAAAEGQHSVCSGMGTVERPADTKIATENIKAGIVERVERR